MAGTLLTIRSIAAFIAILALSALLAAVPVTTSLAQDAQTKDAQTKTGPSGMPLPRFVSLKSDRVNVRAGPGQDHKISWIFAKAGLPVEIVAEYDNWRRIRDSEGDEGWVFHSLLSGRRTSLIAPWSDEKTIDAYRDRGGDAVAVRLEPGVLVNLESCDGTWCRIGIDDLSGYVKQDLLWGVYPKETL